MDYNFLGRLVPRVLDVVRREGSFWEDNRYELYRPRTQLHVLAYVRWGRGLFELDDFSGLLEAGQAFRVSPGRRMSIATSPDDPLCFYSVHFDYGTLRWEGKDGVWEGRSDEPLPLPETFEANEGSGMEAAFARLLEGWEEKGAGYEWRAKLDFLDVVDRFCRQTASLGHPGDPSARAVEESIRLVKANLGGSLDRDTIARRVGFSPGYFSVLFKRSTGYGFAEYVMKLRMDEAKRLLRSSRLPVAEVSTRVGLKDPFYFSRAFKKETGMSPREYRNA